jgi:hypothetical protein
MTSISVGDLSSAIAILRDLDRGDVADAFVKEFVTARGQVLAQGLEDDESFGYRNLDTSLRDAMAAVGKASRAPKSLRNALLQIGKERAWGREDNDAMNAATEEDFYNLFAAEREYVLLLAVTAIGYRNEGADPEQARSRAVAALKRLGAQSRLNAARIKRLLNLPK